MNLSAIILKGSSLDEIKGTEESHMSTSVLVLYFLVSWDVSHQLVNMPTTRELLLLRLPPWNVFPQAVDQTVALFA